MVKNGQLDSTLRSMHHGQANKNYYFLPNVVFTYYIGEKVIVFSLSNPVNQSCPKLIYLWKK